MASKKDALKSKRNIKKTTKSLLALNKNFKDTSNTIDFNMTGADSERREEQDRLNKSLDKIIDTEINTMVDFTGKDMSAFIIKLFNDHDKDAIRQIKDIQDVFNVEDGAVIQFFYERYKNINLLYEDLNVLNEQLFQLNEAVLATRDAIATSDDMSQILSRMITFRNVPDNNELENYINIVKDLEEDDEIKLLSSIKDHVIPKTLTYGNYYVYTIPYSKLFENYSRIKQNDIRKASGIRESAISLESATADSFNSFKKEFTNITKSSEQIATAFNDYVKDIEIYNETVGIPILEGEEIEALFGDDKFKRDVAQSVKKTPGRSNNTLYTDGLSSKKMDTNLDFSKTTGCYIKLLDPRKVIPIRILDKTLGYYYLHETPAKVKSTFTTTITISGSTKTFTNYEQIEHEFISRITDKIVKAFDKKFLENNEKFKSLILDALRYNDLYKKQIKFEFIPADYMTEFKINQDENGNGVSILYRSLFYGKLYLALLLFKMMAVITRSVDTRVYYIKQSGNDQNITNALQNVARSVKEKQLNVMDLLSSNPNLINKIGHLKDLFIPVG